MPAPNTKVHLRQNCSHRAAALSGKREPLPAVPGARGSVRGGPEGQLRWRFEGSVLMAKAHMNG